MLTNLILGTDVAKHFKGLAKLKEMEVENLHHPVDKYFVLEEIFHASDINNPVLNFDTYMTWSSLLAYEFNHQAALERENGYEVTGLFIY